MKGGDYQLDQIHGREEVEAAGGKVISLPFVEGASTTDLIEKNEPQMNTDYHRSEFLSVSSERLNNYVVRQITETREYQKLLAELRANARVISISGLVAGSARALAVAALQRGRQDVCGGRRKPRAIWNRGSAICASGIPRFRDEDADNEILVLPASETDPYAGTSPHAQTLERRALALWRLQQRSLEICAANRASPRAENSHSRSDRKIGSCFAT